MASGEKQTTPEESLKRLQANREGLPWPERRDLAAGLAQLLREGNQSAIGLLKLLAEDSRPEVRKEVAELLHYLPDEDFARLAAKMSADSSFFVQRAVERATDRRRKGARATQRARRGPGQVEAQLAVIEKHHGSLAAERARKLADKQFEVLVGGTVHDVRNILSPLRSDVSNVLRLLDGRRPDLKACRANVIQMGERLEYLERFVNDMREYSLTASAPKHRERIADVVHEARSLALANLRTQGVNGNTVQLAVSVPEGLTAEVSRHQLVMALNHLLRNAVESFEATPSKAPPMQVEVRAQVLAGGKLELAVCDNGPGIHEDDLREYLQFSPGQTTKKSYGTGFGLPTAHRCAEAHGGTLTIASKLGEGTTVTIVIPLEAEDEEE